MFEVQAVHVGSDRGGLAIVLAFDAPGERDELRRAVDGTKRTELVDDTRALPPEGQDLHGAVKSIVWQLVSRPGRSFILLASGLEIRGENGGVELEEALMRGDHERREPG